MKITDKLNKETIVFLTKENRTDAIEELLNQLVKYNYLEKSVKLLLAKSHKIPMVRV